MTCLQNHALGRNTAALPAVRWLKGCTGEALLLARSPQVEGELNDGWKFEIHEYMKPTRADICEDQGG